MISVYFLSTEKKAQVDALVAAGLAVKQETIADSVSEMSLRPTEQLLALCPLQVCRVFSAVLDVSFSAPEQRII